MKHRFFPCPHTNAPRCGAHVGYCKECRQYGRLTIRDRIVTAVIAICLIIVFLIAFMGCNEDRSAKIETITGTFDSHGISLVKYDSCEYLLVHSGYLSHKANCSNTVHKNNMVMDSSLYLFQNSQTINEIIGHIEEVASSKTTSYNLSIGISKNLRGEIKYSVMVVAVDRHGKSAHRIIDGLKDPIETVRELTDFLKAL
jgi:hypothetical protein